MFSETKPLGAPWDRGYRVVLGTCWEEECKVCVQVRVWVLVLLLLLLFFFIDTFQREEASLLGHMHRTEKFLLIIHMFSYLIVYNFFETDCPGLVQIHDPPASVSLELGQMASPSGFSLLKVSGNSDLSMSFFCCFYFVSLRLGTRALIYRQRKLLRVSSWVENGVVLLVFNLHGECGVAVFQCWSTCLLQSSRFDLWYLQNKKHLVCIVICKNIII